MRLACTQGAPPREVGEIIDSPEGLLQGPPPSYPALRQVVTDEICWYSATWISKAGDAYQRVRNVSSSEWVWKEKAATIDESGAMMVLVGGAGVHAPMRLARAIGIAWVSAPLASGRLQIAIMSDGERPAAAVHADMLGWVPSATKSYRLVAPPVVQPDALSALSALDDEGETWVPLRYVWRLPSGDPLERFDSRRHTPCFVSALGSFRTATGVPTKGHRTPSGRLWASVGEEGAIWIDRAVLCSFDSEPASPRTVVHINGAVGDNLVSNLEWGSDEASFALQSSEALVDRALRDGIASLATALAITRQTLWSRLRVAITKLPYTRVAALWRVVFVSLRDHLRHSGSLAWGPMAPLYDQVIAARLRHWGELPEVDRYGMLLVARELAVREHWWERFSTAEGDSV